MTKDAREIQKTFDLLFAACTTISGAGGCDRCPLQAHLCLDGYSANVMDIANSMAAVAWQEFLDFSDDIHRIEEEMLHRR